jgi:hypothetical protein
MPQSLSAVYVHLVFSTKERRAFLRDEQFELRSIHISVEFPNNLAVRRSLLEVWKIMCICSLVSVEPLRKQNG